MEEEMNIEVKRNATGRRKYMATGETSLEEEEEEEKEEEGHMKKETNINLAGK